MIADVVLLLSVYTFFTLRNDTAWLSKINVCLLVCYQSAGKCNNPPSASRDNGTVKSSYVAGKTLVVPHTVPLTH